jgi:large subunit ribosomal protein L46
MNTWVVGRVPIGHHVLQPYNNAEDASKSTSGIKTFFLKARIMAGQASLKENALGLEDFKWLTKEEVSKVVGNKYWSSVKNFLHDR